MSYPTLGSAEFQSNILKSPEFHEVFQPSLPLVGGLEELKRQREALCGHRDFRLMNHQVFLKRFFSDETPYKSGLFYHGTGVGKTCTAISIAEEYLAAPQNEGNKVIIISSEAVRHSFRKEIFSMDNVSKSAPHSSKQCTGTTYIRRVERMRRTALRLESTPDRDQVSELIDRLVAQNYEFAPYQSFSNQVLNRQTSMSETSFHDWLKDTYSNRLLIVDEAHNSRPSQSSSEKRVEQALRLIVKHAQNTNLILMSATPMYNEFSEILWLLNLCVWNDKRRELFKTEKSYQTGFQVSDLFKSDGQLKNADSEATVRMLVRSYVSFVRGDDPLRFPFRLPAPHTLKHSDLPTTDTYGRAITEPLEDLELVGSKVGTEQEAEYLKLLKTNEKELKTSIDSVEEEVAEEPQTIVTRILAKGNIVYPKSSGTFENSFTFKRGSDTLGSVRVSYAPGLPHFLSPSELPKHAPKMASIIQSIDKGDGVCFVYSNFKNDGVLPLALALEEAGYHPYGNPDGFLSSIPADAKKKGAYILLTGSNKLVNKDVFLDRDIKASRDPANQNGSKVKIILGTKRVNEGVDFRFIRQLHILEPWFNLSLIDQVIGRGLRTCSHTLLPFEKQNCTVYLHALMLTATARESLDVMAYRVSESKARKIATITAILRESAFDCLAAYGKNHLHATLLDTVIPQTRSEDGKELKLSVKDLTSPLFSEITERVCESGQNDSNNLQKLNAINHIPIRFLRDRETDILVELGNLYRENVVWKWDDIIDRLGDYSSDSVMAVLLEAVRFPNRYTFIDKLNRRGHLEKRGNTFSFLPDELKHLKASTTFERSQPIPMLKKIIDAPVLVGDATNSVTKSKIGKIEDPSDLLELFYSFANQHMESLVKIDVPQSVVDKVGLEQAFDIWNIPKRLQMFKSLLLNPSLDKVLWDRIVVPRQSFSTNAWMIMTPQGTNIYPQKKADGSIDWNEIPLGAVEAQIQQFERKRKSEFVNFPRESFVGATEFKQSANKSTFKLHTEVVDAKGKECVFFDKSSLQSFADKVGYKTEMSSSKCAGLDAHLRFKVGEGSSMYRYMVLEERVIIHSIRKTDFPTK